MIFELVLYIIDMCINGIYMANICTISLLNKKQVLAYVDLLF